MFDHLRAFRFPSTSVPVSAPPARPLPIGCLSWEGVAGRLRFSGGKLSFGIVYSDFRRTFWSNHSCSLLFTIAHLMVAMTAFHKVTAEQLTLCMWAQLRPSSGHWSCSVLDRAKAWRGGRRAVLQKAARAEKNATKPYGFKLACVYKTCTGLFLSVQRVGTKWDFKQMTLGERLTF